MRERERERARARSHELEIYLFISCKHNEILYIQFNIVNVVDAVLLLHRLSIDNLLNHKLSTSCKQNQTMITII